jgi:ABC-type antimicrobial peptide transport system permease subunit
MTWLPLANVMHRKARTCLSVLAVGIGIAMLIVMLALSHGTLSEVSDRMQSVDAELVVLPRQDNVIFTAGAPFSDKYVELIAETEVGGRKVVEAVIPVMFDQVRMGGQQQRLFGVDPEQFSLFLGARRLVEGRVFDGDLRFKTMLARRSPEGRRYDPADITEEELNAACELVIDTRLARVGDYRVGDTVTALGREFRIVGIVEAGVAGRVFTGIQVLRHLKNAGVPWSSMFFVKLADFADAEAAADAVAGRTKARVELKNTYGELLFQSFAQIYLYTNIASGVALVVCFLIIVLTMYTMVVERRREIGIMRSLGATRGAILRGALGESLLICQAGTILGIVLAFSAKYGIERAKPLLTVTIEPRWVLLALVVGVVGGTVSALYPGWRAARLDPGLALTLD